jgi:hypothetical protein
MDPDNENGVDLRPVGFNSTLTWEFAREDSSTVPGRENFIFVAIFETVRYFFLFRTSDPSLHIRTLKRDSL